MKTSIFDMSFVLPPLVEMTQVEKELPSPCSGLGPTLYDLHPACCW